MEILLQKLYDSTGHQVGCKISAVLGISTTRQQKNFIEFHLQEYAFNVIYPKRGILIFQDLHSDTPSIIVLDEVDRLPEKRIELDI